MTSRREFMMLLGGAVGAAWPLTARAQQAATPVIGFLHSGSPEPIANRVAAFRKGLNEIGYVEDRNVAIEYRWAHNDNNRLPELAADLVRRRVAVIVTLGSVPATLAAKAATATIPIIFQSGMDPVKAGVVSSLNRPGGNATGVTSMNAELPAKLLGLLHELMPRAACFAALVNPNNLATEPIVADLRSAATTIGRQIEILTASSNRDIDPAFASLSRKQADALLVSPDPLFNDRRRQLITLAAHHRVPVVYPWRESAEAGGLLSYGTSIADQNRQAGIYTGRVLKGERPADLPIVRPTKFDLVINLITAKALGLEIPPTLLTRADEVIE
jgi:putative ABC transport system substrate-binding protein